MDSADGNGKIDMKRKWNWPIWVGFVVALGGLFSYGFFVRFPITRDFPWANLLLLGIGVALLIVGLFRAFEPATTLSWEDLRLDPHSNRPVSFRVFQLRNVLRPTPGSALHSRATGWRKSAGLHIAGSKRAAGRLGRFAFRIKGCRADFLSRFLVTALQLRVAEFPAKSFRV
jgi:hypothetical protein